MTYPSFFLYIANILCVTRNPPKIFIAANEIAKKPNILDVLKTLSESPAKPAIIAPTIITEEIKHLSLTLEVYVKKVSHSKQHNSLQILKE